MHIDFKPIWYKYSCRLMLLTVVSLIGFWKSPSSKVGSIIINILGSTTFPCIIGSLLTFRLKETAWKGTNSVINKSTNFRTTNTMIFN